MNKTLNAYLNLMRLDKPIGILLLLWPTLWALWLATSGKPSLFICFIFIMGVIVMRSFGCVINDIADRHKDGYVVRTRMRPLVCGLVSMQGALILLGILGLCALLLALQCNVLTILLAPLGALLAVIYPFMKRFTYFPQVGLGVAFAFSIPMAFAAETNSLPPSAWYVFFTALIWPIIYDTMYAMADREDDLIIGIKSTAIAFANWECVWVAGLQIVFLGMLILLGQLFQLTASYYLSLLGVSVLFVYQLTLIMTRDPKKCLQAFKNNHWVGFLIFLGIYLSYLT